MIKINPPIGQQDELVLVPLKDLQRLMKAWREREAGNIKSGQLLDIFERWSSYIPTSTQSR